MVLLAAPLAQADVYQVGSGRPYAQLQDVLDDVTLQPGDVVEVDGNQTYVPVQWDEGGAHVAVVDGPHTHDARLTMRTDPPSDVPYSGADARSP
jgi:hypothetical protein